MDNEVSNTMKSHIRDNCKLELVPTRCHRQNATEVGIRNFKNHFPSVLAGVAYGLPPSLWDCLLPQTKITLNLLRQSNATPTVSAYAHLNGPFDYNKMPLAPMGCAVQVHKNLTPVAPGHTTPQMDGIQQCHQTTIKHTRVISSPHKVRGYPTRSTSSTKTSRTHRYCMPTRS